MSVEVRYLSKLIKGDQLPNEIKLMVDALKSETVKITNFWTVTNWRKDSANFLMHSVMLNLQVNMWNKKLELLREICVKHLILVDCLYDDLYHVVLFNNVMKTGMQTDFNIPN